MLIIILILDTQLSSSEASGYSSMEFAGDGATANKVWSSWDSMHARSPFSIWCLLPDQFFFSSSTTDNRCFQLRFSFSVSHVVHHNIDARLMLGCSLWYGYYTIFADQPNVSVMIITTLVPFPIVGDCVAWSMLVAAAADIFLQSSIIGQMSTYFRDPIPQLALAASIIHLVVIGLNVLYILLGMFM